MTHNALLKRAREAPFLAEALDRMPAIADVFLREGAAAAVAMANAIGEGVDLRRSLRIRRRALALAVALGDLSGELSLEDVFAHLSDFADDALHAAIADAIQQRVPGADVTGFTAIALGKHGSRELNYSSDIDPILLFDPDALPRRERDDAGEAAVRIARHVVDLLQSRDEHGYVLRVDLRLRPASEATPLALPVEAAIGHYESSALAWERVAFVRARAAAGALPLGQTFLHAIRPFVWRRTLDFGAIDELRGISRQIREHYAEGQVLGPGYDLKRGRGGIREVEFFVQVYQLIHGGRDISLRAPSTLGAINALARAGHFGEATATSLADAYRVLRTVEHRLQMMEDRQTHSLPIDPAAIDAVARLHDLSGGKALIDLLAPHAEAVAALFDALDEPARPSIPRAADQVEMALRAAGFADPVGSASRIAGWRTGRARALRSQAAVSAFEAVLPDLIVGFGAAPDPDAALGAFDALLERLPSAINLFRLLEARPALLATLADIMAHAPVLSEALAAKPALLDHLVDRTAFDSAGSVEVLVADMRGTGDLETQLDRVRHVAGDHRFALGTQIVLGAADPLEVAAGYARVAEAAVVTVADAVIASFAEAHGLVPNSELVILALGRLGGGALTHASDLDLIYLFTGDFDAESDGAKPLGATHYYNRLGQRLSGGLSAPTSAGTLYEVDTRLRPSGAQGPLVVSLSSFERYQRESAWTWEHMALTRARPIYGSAQAQADVAAIIDRILRLPRHTATVQADALKMRADMARHKPPMGPLDIKLVDGGLVDLEFIVHVLQLTSGRGITPDLDVAVDALLGPDLREDHALMTRLLVALRLMAPDLSDVAVLTRPVISRACGVEDWSQLLARVNAARQNVKKVRDRVFGKES